MNFLRPVLVLVLLLASTGTAVSQKLSPDDLRNGPKVLQAFRGIVAKPSVSTVRVLADDKEVAFGIIIGADGWVLTKWDELKGKSKIACKLKYSTDLPVVVASTVGLLGSPLGQGRFLAATALHPGRIEGKTLEAKVIGMHAEYDLAMLKIDAKKLPAVQWSDTKNATVGKWVASVGTSEDPVAVGVISVAKRPFKLGDQPLKTINTNAAYLGVGLAPGMGGAKVTVVNPKTPAEKAGLKTNDIVYEAAGREIGDDQTLIATIQQLKPGDEVLLKVKRGDENLELKAKLAPLPKEMLGNPQETMGTKLSVRRGGFPTILQHDSGVRPEQCGGPLVDLDGKIIGINVSRAGRTETYAIPAEDVKGILADLMAGNLPPKVEAVKTAIVPTSSNLVLRSVSKLSAKDPASKLRPDRFSKSYDVLLAAGASYTFEMESIDVDSYLILEDIKGNKLAEDDNGGGGNNAKIVFTSKVEGTYRIIATTMNPNETGRYTLTVRKQEPAKEKEKK